jgi:hypothetical protein
MASINDGKTWELVNVNASLQEEGDKKYVLLQVVDDKPIIDTPSAVGIAYIANLEFSEGIIEVDLKGKNVFQESFVGIAFSGVDQRTYEATYFRPFNFNPDDAARRLRAVQYISWPDHPWERFRDEHPGVYEKPVNPVPDPDSWFHARIEVTKENVNVFVEGAEAPSLTVARVGAREKGKVGLWTDMYEGRFANLRITPAE